MSTLLDLSEKILESDISYIVDALEAVDARAKRLRIPFFVVGAIARDVIFMEHWIEPTRKTYDLDIGIQVANWKQFDNLVSELIADDNFSNAPFVPTYVRHFSS